MRGCPLIGEAIMESAPKMIKYGEVSSLTPPGVFIGTYNYPKVYAGPLAVAELESPYPTGNEYGKSIEEILGLGRNLYRASKTTAVKDVNGKFSRSLQESAMSSNHVDIEMNISGRLDHNLDHESKLEAPLRSMIQIGSLKMTSNPKVPRKVEYLHGDTDLKAVDSVWSLYNLGFPIDYLEGVLSSGALGVGKNRKLVPTRWSITAVDDILYRRLKEEISLYETISEVRVFRNSYLGNNFTIILLPYTFSFEMQELWTGGSAYDLENRVLMDYELSRGRKTYASNVGGAYYAARVAVMEYLRKIKRQASAIVLRTIGNEYYSPLGVWVVRETVRHAMIIGHTEYSSIEETAKNLDTGIGNWSARSKVVSERFVQARIMDYL